MICKRCGNDAIELAGNFCEGCRELLNLDGCGRPKRPKVIEFVEMVNFANHLNALREAFPELAKELDKCLFEVMNNHTPKCGHGNCSCQTMTAEEFHRERNLKFGTTGEAKSYEFNQ